MVSPALPSCGSSSSVTSAASAGRPNVWLRCIRPERTWRDLTTRCLGNWVNITLFTAMAGFQVPAERCGCLIGGCWDILCFLGKFRVLGYFGQRIGKENTIQKTPLSWMYSPGACWFFSFLWVKSVHLGFYFTSVFADHVSTSTLRGRQYLQSAVVTLPGW